VAPKEEPIVSDGLAGLWASYFQHGLISRRQLLKTTALLGGTAAAGAKALLPAGTTRAAMLAPADKQILRQPDNEPLHFDPGTMEARNEILIGMSLFEPLVTFDNAGRTLPLAARAWEVSADGLTYTFHLRPGMHWSDGHPVTASDYAYAWKRVADPQLASDYAAAVYPIKGAIAFNKGQTKDPNTIAVEAPSPLVLRVTLVEPAAYFLRLVSTWTYLPVPRWQVEKYGKKWVEAGHHVGNGPFMLQTWEHDQRIVIVPNPHYWGSKPTLQQIVFTLSDDPYRTSLPAYEDNSLDVTWTIEPGGIDHVRRDAVLRSQLHKYRWSGTAMMFCDTTNTQSPLSHPKVRQALYLAIDRNRLVNEVLRGLYDPATTITPPGTLGYLATPPLTGGVARARQLLAEAGYPGGKGFPGFPLVWAKKATYDLTAQALQGMWRDTLGITNVQLQRMEAKEYNAAFNSWATQPFGAFISRWGSDFEDPYDWANELFDSQADFFHTKWHNARYDALIRKGAGEAKPATRKSLYEQAERILNTELPAIPLYHLASVVLVKPWVSGYVVPAAAAEWSGMFAGVKILSH
jgi:oligopeptide transport system substrate-binding protein